MERAARYSGRDNNNFVAEAALGHRQPPFQLTTRICIYVGVYVDRHCFAIWSSDRVDRTALSCFRRSFLFDNCCSGPRFNNVDILATALVDLGSLEEVMDAIDCLNMPLFLPDSIEIYLQDN